VPAALNPAAHQAASLSLRPHPLGRPGTFGDDADAVLYAAGGLSRLAGGQGEGSWAHQKSWRVVGLLAKPDDVYTDPDVVAHTQDVLRSLDTAPTMTQPTRAELEAALA
jgi:hypothetical protein